MAALLLAFLVGLPGCSLRVLAVNAAGNALASGGAGWGSDDDPELVRDALPFALKTMESLLAESPRHRGLLLGACSGFTQYAFAFVQSDADYVEATDLARATALRRRALRLYLRARDYGLRGLEVAHPGVTTRLVREPDAALAVVRRREDVPLLYWTAMAWGAAISLAKDNAELTADLPVAAALARRALALDERFGGGAIWDFFIAYEGRPAASGGSLERARAAFERAVALSGGRRAAPYVTYAESIAVGTQDRAGFDRALGQALAVDVVQASPERLGNLLAQRRARWLQQRADELFIE